MFDNVRKKREASPDEYGEENFGRQYLGSFPKPDESFKKAYRAWLSYYDQLEEYQQKTCVCRTPEGIAIPSTTEEMRLSNQKARLLRQELFEPLKLLKIPTDIECRARSLALQEHDRKWRKETTPAPSKKSSSGRAPV